MTHGIHRGYDAFANPQLLWDCMEQVAGMQDRLWVCTLHDGWAYATERDSVQLDIKANRQGHLTVTPSLPLDKKLFFHPLSLVVDGVVAEATQGGKKLPVQQKENRSVVDFNPHGGTIKLHFQR